MELIFFPFSADIEEKEINSKVNGYCRYIDYFILNLFNNRKYDFIIP